jgi:uncharacterized protein (TIGR00304 family)
MPDLVTLGTLVIIAGILMVFLATIFASHSKHDGEKEVEVKGGGVIMIGPIPIIFGTDPKWAVVAMVLAIVLIVLSLFQGRAL